MNGKTKCADADDAVLTAIRQRVTTASAIEEFTWLKMRSVDRALQRLRLAGKIEFERSKRAWRIKR